MSGRSRHLTDHAQRDHHRTEVLPRRHAGAWRRLMAKMNPVFVPRGALPVVLSRDGGYLTDLRHPGTSKHSDGPLDRLRCWTTRQRSGRAEGPVIVDSTRMTLRIQQGKGGNDRYARLSPVMLDRLRTWWRVARAQGKMLEGGWLFPGLNPVEPLSTASTQPL